MFTRSHQRINVLLALALLAASLAFAPLRVAAKSGDGDPPQPPAVQCYQVKSENNQRLVSGPGCGKVGSHTPRPRYTLYVTGRLLFVDGARFAQRHTYNIRVRKPGGNWVNLGIIKANRSGKVSDSYRLPSNMRRATNIYVCLKDVSGGRAYCGWAERVY
jgi:hypothetical protein